MGTNYKAALSVVIGATLSACGGSDTTPAINTPAPIIKTSSAVSVDASIPESVRQQVAEIVSSVATVDKIPRTIVVGEGEDIVLALDAQGKIIMTGVAAADGTTAFNATSTAVGLVSFALDTPENLTEKQVNAKIRAAAGFAQLTERVDTVLKAGKIVSSESNVLEQVLLVAQQVKKSTTVAVASKGARLMTTARELPTTPSVTTDYPFTLVETENWIGKVSFDTNKTVKNTIPLAWSVVAKNSNGDVLPNGDLVLQPAGIGARSVDAIGNTFGGIWTFLGRLTSPSVTVPDDNGKSFELIVAQTPEILRYNKAHALVDTILKGLDLQADTGDKCQLAYVKAVMSSKDMSNLLTADPDNIMIRLGQWQANVLSMSNVLSSSADLVDKCGSQAAKDTILSQAKRISTKMAYLVPIYGQFKTVKKTYDFATLAERFFLIAHYQDEEPAVYTVCINKNGGVGNCAVEYQITNLETTLPVDSPMTAGAEFGVSVAAKDAKGNSTLVPAELDFDISDKSKLSYDPITQKFTSLASGRPTISVKDKVTTAKSVAPVTINIDAPRFNKTKIILKVGETVTLPLQNAQGQNIVLNGETDWGTNLQGEVAGGVVAIYPNGFTTPKSTGTQIRIKGLKAGKTLIAGVNVADGNYTEKVEVVVDNGSGNYVKISATGQQLPDSATTWNCVLDKQTDLMWENKTDDGGLRYYDYSYSWFENSTGYDKPYSDQISTCGNTLVKCNTKAFITAVNTQKLCGYSNWRLPNKEELVGIGSKSDKTNYFFRYTGLYWSASSYAYDNNAAWYVDFYNGDQYSAFNKSYGFYVRAVRISQ